MEARIYVEKRITHKDIAELAGVSKSTVRNVMGGKTWGKYNEKTIAKVKAAARELNYIPNVIDKREGKLRLTTIKPEPKWYRNGNYRTEEEERARMLELRAEGFSNAQIAKKVGRTHCTVLKRIGHQPEEITKMSRRMSGSWKKESAAARKACAAAILEAKRKAELEAKVHAYQNKRDELEREAAILRDKLEQLEMEHSRRATEAELWNTHYGIAMTEISHAVQKNEDNVIKLAEFRTEAEKAAEMLGIAI